MDAASHRPIILVADDHALFRETLSTYFSSAGCNVHTAADGDQAWDILLESMDQIDAVVTDHRMPGLTGLEITQLLRQTTYRGRIFVFTSALNARDESAYRDVGVDGVFFKDTRPEELVRAVLDRCPKARLAR